MNFKQLCGAGLLLASLLATSAEARSQRYYMRHGMPYGAYGYGHGGMMGGCCLPPMDCCVPIHGCCDPCGCAQPMMPVVQQMQQPVYQTQLRPVYQTTLQPQQVVTYQQVPQIQYQRQAYVEQVPVTVYQPQMRYRDVAVQVNQLVAQTQTQMIPRQTVQYVPETRMVGMQTMGTQVVGWQPGVPTLGGYQYGVPALGAYPMTYQMGGYSTAPMTAGLPMLGMPGEPIPDAMLSTEKLTPDPYHTPSGIVPQSSDGATIIRQRQAGGATGQTSYMPMIGTGIVPTAATVWQAQLQTAAFVR